MNTQHTPEIQAQLNAMADFTFKYDGVNGGDEVRGTIIEENGQKQLVIEYKGENNRILHEMMDGILLTTNAKGLSSSYEYGTESEPTRLKASYSLRAQSADGAVSPDGVLTIDLAQSIDPKPLLEAAIKAFQDITVKANHMGLMPAIIAYKQEHGIIASMKVVSTKGMVGGQPLATPVSPAIDTAAAKILADRELSKILPQTLKI